MAAPSERGLWKLECLLCALNINKYADTAWPVLNRQTWTPVPLPTLQMMADTQKCRQLLNEHPPRPNTLPPVYAPHWELYPDDSSKCSLHESTTMDTLVALGWFDALIESCLSLLLQSALGFPFLFQFVSGCIKIKLLERDMADSQQPARVSLSSGWGLVKPLLGRCCPAILQG